MKKIKYIIGTFLGLSSVGIIAPIVASCSTNNSAEPDYYENK